MTVRSPYLWAFTLLTACGGNLPPPPGSLDGGRDTPDSRIVGDAPVAISIRPDTSVLPPSTQEVQLPFGGTASYDVTIQVSVARLDVHFSIDTTGSFDGEIDSLQSDLDSRIVPELSRRVEDVAFGVSSFEDFPIMPFGGSADVPFQLFTPVTRDLSRVRSGVASLDQPIGAGGDLPESGAEALYQIATGVGIPGYVPAFPSGATTRGGVGFREGAFPIVVHVTDAPTHTPMTYSAEVPESRTVAEAATALNVIGARVIGIASGAAARPHLEEIALRTNAAIPPTREGCPTGVGRTFLPVGASGVCPLVFDIQADGSGLSAALIDAIVALVNTVRFREVHGEVLTDRLDFVEGIDAVSALAPDSSPVARGDSRPADGVDDTFFDVPASARLVFRIRLRNRSVPDTDHDQAFRVAIRITGDERVLHEDTIRVVVPGRRLGLSDAGADTGSFRSQEAGASADASGDSSFPNDDAQVD